MRRFFFFFEPVSYQKSHSKSISGTTSLCHDVVALTVAGQTFLVTIGTLGREDGFQCPPVQGLLEAESTP